MALNLTVKVAGVTFEGRQEYISQLIGDEPCRIEPEPENPYDANALAVKVAMHDGRIVHIGYVPRDLACHIAPLLEGESLMVRIKAITGGFDTWDGGKAADGVQIRIWIPDEQSTGYTGDVQ